MSPNTRAWIRSLPLLLMSSVLMIVAAWMFFQGKDGTASIAAFSAGLVLLGSWLATAVVDWHEGHAPILPPLVEEVSSDDDSGS
jgi:hypothetical protein